MRVSKALLFLAVLISGASPLVMAEDYQVVGEFLEKRMPGFEVESYAMGDLNSDSIQDLVVALIRKGQSDSEFEPSTLQVYLFKKDKSAYLVLDLPKALCRDCGGSKGGPTPFSLGISKGVLSITMTYGHRVETESTSKWRLKGKEFSLIGITISNDDTLSTEGEPWKLIRDANISTLKMSETTIETPALRSDEPPAPGKSKTIRCKVPKHFKEMKLSEYKEDSLRDLTCGALNGVF